MSTVSLAFMRRHPAHWIALGFGSGLSPWAPGTVGTLFAWGSFLLLDRWLSVGAWALLLGAALVLGCWACTRCAQQLGAGDPGAIVWDEIVAFWALLWIWTPADLAGQIAAFALFRAFDALKPPPVSWADACFKPAPGTPIGWRAGFGILFDDLVAALCALLLLALGSAAWN